MRGAPGRGSPDQASTGPVVFAAAGIDEADIEGRDHRLQPFERLAGPGLARQPLETTGQAMGGERHGIEAFEQPPRRFAENRVDRRLVVRSRTGRKDDRLGIRARWGDLRPQGQDAIELHDFAADPLVWPLDELLDHPDDGARGHAERRNLDVGGLPAGGRCLPFAAPEGRGTRLGDRVDRPARQHFAAQAALLAAPRSLDPTDYDTDPSGFGHDRPADHEQQGDDGEPDRDATETVEEGAQPSETSGEDATEPSRLHLLGGTAGGRRLEARWSFLKAVHGGTPCGPSGVREPPIDAASAGGSIPARAPVGRAQALHQTGARFSRKASMPSAASRASMFSVMTRAV